MTGDEADIGWAERWQRSWDRQQEGYMPDREARLGALVDIVEAVAGPAPVVLDLACGTGSISRRLLARLPRARSVAVDVDPALLAIAGASVGADERVTVVRADLTGSMPTCGCWCGRGAWWPTPTTWARPTWSGWAPRSTGWPSTVAARRGPTGARTGPPGGTKPQPTRSWPGRWRSASGSSAG